MFDQHNVASSLYFFFKSDIKFYFRNFDRHLFTRSFRSKIAALKTSLWARPLKTERVCSQEARSRSTSGCVPEETHGDTGFTNEKRL